MRYALRFIAGRFEGGEFPIKPNREIIIGRGSEHDMVLDEEMVSRAHAKIASFHGRIVIQDLKSTNGTYVNGDRADSAVLQTGDRILVGSSVMELVSLDTQPPRQIPTPVTGPKGPNAMRSTTTLQGLLEGSFPDEMVLELALEKAGSIGISGVFSVTADNGDTVDIYLEDGGFHSLRNPSNAGTSPSTAQKIFYRLMLRGSGSFRFKVQACDDSWGDRRDDSIASFVGRGKGHNAELEPLMRHLPNLEQNFSLSHPLKASLSELSVEALETLQLLHNLDHLGAVLDASEATDLETVQDVLYLIQNAYITTG